MLVFVPLDIYLTLKNGQANEQLITLWYVVYWTSFTLNWTLFPFTYSYLEAGDFTKKGKVCSAIKKELP